MSGRGRIKSKVVRSTIQNKDVLNMFHEVLGTSTNGVDLSIAHPKYELITRNCRRFIELLTKLSESKTFQLFENARVHLTKYIKSLREQYIQSCSAPDLDIYMDQSTLDGTNYDNVPPEVEKQFSSVFQECKKCNLVNLIIVTCKNLIAHKHQLKNVEQLNDKFLVQSGGISFAPLPELPALNFKQIYIDDRLTAQNKKYVLVALHKLYEISHDLYTAVSSPDINVDEFSEIIMSSLGEVKKQIPRCDAAFDKIADSVGLLKGNFDGYYRDFVASNNPTVIMENFVMDVSKNTKSNPKVTVQFRKIITHYRKIASQKSTNPKLQTLFQQVDKNFTELERKGRKADESLNNQNSQNVTELQGGESSCVPSASQQPATNGKPIQESDNSTPEGMSVIRPVETKTANRNKTNDSLPICPDQPTTPVNKKPPVTKAQKKRRRRRKRRK